MKNALRDGLNALAATFAAGVVAALRAANVEDVSAVSGILQAANLPAHVTRVAHETVAERMALIVKYMKSHPGTTGEAARKALGLPKHTWSNMAAKAVAQGRLRKEGDRRATRYWAV
jgi:hypothetical protein